MNFDKRGPLCGKCCCLILRREGQSDEEVLEAHRKPKFYEVKDLLLGDRIEINPCWAGFEK